MIHSICGYADDPTEIDCGTVYKRKCDGCGKEFWWYTRFGVSNTASSIPRYCGECQNKRIGG